MWNRAEGSEARLWIRTDTPEPDPGASNPRARFSLPSFETERSVSAKCLQLQRKNECPGVVISGNWADTGRIAIDKKPRSYGVLRDTLLGSPPDLCRKPVSTMASQGVGGGRNFRSKSRGCRVPGANLECAISEKLNTPISKLGTACGSAPSPAMISFHCK